MDPDPDPQTQLNTDPDPGSGSTTLEYLTVNLNNTLVGRRWFLFEQPSQPNRYLLPCICALPPPPSGQFS
jgi:hypothetical protein